MLRKYIQWDVHKLLHVSSLTVLSDVSSIMNIYFFQMISYKTKLLKMDFFT